MQTEDFVIINESTDASVSGDVFLCLNERDASSQLEGFDVLNNEYVAMSSSGEFLGISFSDGVVSFFKTGIKSLILLDSYVKNIGYYSYDLKSEKRGIEAIGMLKIYISQNSTNKKSR
jgi:hypothetical protein